MDIEVARMLLGAGADAAAKDVLGVTRCMVPRPLVVRM
jgi:hypothetical protein